MRKKWILKAVNKMPNNIDLDEVIERLLVVEKIEKGLEEAEKGKLISHETVKRRIKKWSK